MNTLTININDRSVIPGLLDYLNKVGGISIVESDICESTDMEDRTLTREEGEALVAETLVPAIKDVIEARRNGIKMPEAHELLNIC